MAAVIAGLVLDVDDTLYLERDYVRSGFNHLDTWCRDHLGVAGVGGRAWALFKDGRRRTTITDALTDLGIDVDAKVRDLVVGEYQRHLPSIALLPDARALLDRWGADAPLAVVTDGPAVSQRAKCEALSLAAWTDRVVVTDEHGSSKPDLEVFRLAVHGWDLPPGSLVYVADNPAKDFQGPLALGWRAIRVRRPGSLHEGIPTPPGVREVTDLSPASLDAIVGQGLMPGSPRSSARGAPRAARTRSVGRSTEAPTSSPRGGSVGSRGRAAGHRPRWIRVRPRPRVPGSHLAAALGADEPGEVPG